MSKLIVFENTSVDGYFTDVNGDMGWAYAGGDDPEFRAFTATNAKGEAILAFGRVTYEMMKSYWPTEAAAQAMPDVAEGMNRMEKIVFSRSLQDAGWRNVRIVGTDPVAEMSRLKRVQGKDMVIMGSGSIVAPLAQAGVVDEYHLVISPTALGAGRTIFDGISHPVPMRLLNSRTFKNGKTFLSYAAAG